MAYACVWLGLSACACVRARSQLHSLAAVHAQLTEEHTALSRETRFPLDEPCILRYLRAHNLDADKAAAGIIKTLL